MEEKQEKKGTMVTYICSCAEIYSRVSGNIELFVLSAIFNCMINIDKKQLSIIFIVKDSNIDINTDYLVG